MDCTKEKIENFTGLKIGDTVAYNRSGDVLIGVVESLNPVQHYFYNRKSRIEVNAIIRSREDGAVSKVKNMKSLVNLSGLFV